MTEPPSTRVPLAQLRAAMEAWRVADCAYGDYQLRHSAGYGPDLVARRDRTWQEYADLLHRHADALIAAAEATEKIRALHPRDERPDSDHFYCDPDNCDRAGEGELVGVCDHCDLDWPCPTIAALPPIESPEEKP